MNSVFSIRKVLKDAFSAVLDNFSTLFFRMFQMYAYLLVIALIVMFLCGMPLYTFSLQGVSYSFEGFNLYGFSWPMGWTFGSLLVFLCYVNLYMQYQKCLWRALHNQDIASFKINDFSFMVFGLAILLTIIVVSGYVLLVIPGIYFSLRLGYAYIVYAIEEKSITDSLRRSWELTRGHTMKILGLSLISFVLRPLSFITYPFVEAITVSTYKQLVDVGHRH